MSAFAPAFAVRCGNRPLHEIGAVGRVGAEFLFRRAPARFACGR